MIDRNTMVFSFLKFRPQRGQEYCRSGQNLTTIGAKRYDSMRGGLFRGGRRNQRRGKCRELSGVGTANIGVRCLRSVLEFEAGLPYKHACDPDFLQVTPLHGPHAFPPASVTLHGKEQNALVGNDNHAGCQHRRPPSRGELLQD
jgi:hypothetical protein